MSLALAQFTERLVPISDFSQGKAGKIFADVCENNNEYVVLKNNQPTAVVISVEQYKATQNRIARLEKILEACMRLEGASENVEFEQMTDEELYSKLECSRRHAREDKNKDADNMVAETETKL